MGFRIDKSRFDRSLMNLVGRVSKPMNFLKTWGNSVAKQARKNARSKGGRKFWRGIAQSTRMQQVSESSVAVGSDHFAAAQKQFGGVIKAKPGKALTIPIADEAKGKTAAEFEMGGRQLFIAKGILFMAQGGRRGSVNEERPKALFVLRKSVTQKAEPWFPEEEEITSLGMKEGAFWLELEVKGAVK